MKMIFVAIIFVVWHSFSIFKIVYLNSNIILNCSKQISWINEMLVFFRFNPAMQQSVFDFFVQRNWLNYVLRRTYSFSKGKINPRKNVIVSGVLYDFICLSNEKAKHWPSSPPPCCVCTHVARHYRDYVKCLYSYVFVASVAYIDRLYQWL